MHFFKSITAAKLKIQLGNSLPKANRFNQVSPCILDRLSGQLSPGHGRPEGGRRRLLAVELRVDETNRNHRRHLLFSFLSKVQKVPLKLRKTPQRQHFAEDKVPLGAGRRLPPCLVGGQVEAVLVGVLPLPLLLWGDQVGGEWW